MDIIAADDLTLGRWSKYRQVTSHLKQGLVHARHAAGAQNGLMKAESALRAVDNFEHAADDAVRLIPGKGQPTRALRYLEVAKRAAEAALAANPLPQARTIHGLSELKNSRDHYVSAAAVSQKIKNPMHGRSRELVRMATDWMAHAADDAISGSIMVRNADYAKDLLGALAESSAQILRFKPVTREMADNTLNIYRDGINALNTQLAGE